MQSKIYQFEKNEIILKDKISANENIIKRSENMISFLQNEKLFLIQESLALKTGLKKLEENITV